MVLMVHMQALLVQAGYGGIGGDSWAEYGNNPGYSYGGGTVVVIASNIAGTGTCNCARSGRRR